jgi:hypothetical protein
VQASDELVSHNKYPAPEFCAERFILGLTTPVVGSVVGGLVRIIGAGRGLVFEEKAYEKTMLICERHFPCSLPVDVGLT